MKVTKIFLFEEIEEGFDPRAVGLVEDFLYSMGVQWSSLDHAMNIQGTELSHASRRVLEALSGVKKVIIEEGAAADRSHFLSHF